jgi:lysozyme
MSNAMNEMPTRRHTDPANPAQPDRLAVGEPGLAIIRRFDPFRAEPYLHRNGYHAIGYGHRIRDWGIDLLDPPIARATAEELLRQDLAPIALYLNATTRVTLAQHQFDALVSLIFDVGIRAFERSPLRAHLHQGESAAVVAEIYRFRDHGSSADPSYPAHLRRDAEARLFMGPPAK